MKKKILVIFFIGHFALLFLLNGCVSISRSYPEKHYFVLSASMSKKMLPPTANAVLKIQRFRVSPQFDGQSFVYKTGNLNYESDFYNEFFIPPGLMISEEVQKWLAESGLFKYVMEFSSPVEPTFELNGVVNALYGDYSNIERPKAVLEIQFFLVRKISSRPVIVFGKTYHEETRVKGNSPDALVAGWNLALEHILTRFETNLKGLDLSERRTS
jgi:cholesterol transport system auxiliary component